MRESGINILMYSEKLLITHGTEHLLYDNLLATLVMSILFLFFFKSSNGVIVCKVGGRHHLYKDVDKIGYLCKILYT